MSESENRAANWTIGLVGSIGLHALVLGLFVMAGSTSDATLVSASAAGELPAEVAPSAPSPAVPAPRETTPAPAHVESARPAVTHVAPPRPAPAPAPAETKVYVVQKGDNASQIAKKFNLTLQQLATLNDSSVKKLAGLAVGQKLKVAE